MSESDRFFTGEYRTPPFTRHQIGCASCESVFQCHGIPEYDPRYIELNKLAESGSVPTHDSSEDGSCSQGAMVTIKPCDREDDTEYKSDGTRVCRRGVDQLREMADVLGIEIVTEENPAFAEDMNW